MKKTLILSLTLSAFALSSISSAAFAQSEPTVAPMVDESAPGDAPAAAPKAEHGKKKGHKKAKSAKAKKHAKKKHKAKKDHSAAANHTN